ncbi:transglutaminase domain-containing protein [Lysinibacillus sp. SGAir0095]|uniref:transglutaminase domain-containing protein n=1 Tax=Lysinibacillus sp. SGAir0095 TaxID=2070463 RepID=UPI00143DA648|nr:transglutaminase-like domain-containing protein [Lysinibacillus sp. SGAir0095]
MNEQTSVEQMEVAVNGNTYKFDWFDRVAKLVDIPIYPYASETTGKTLLELFEDNRYIKNAYGAILEVNNVKALQETIQSSMLEYDHHFLISYRGDEIEKLEQFVANAYYNNPMILGTVGYITYGVEKSDDGRYFLHFDIGYTTNNIEMVTIKPKFEEFYTKLDLDGKSVDEKISIIHRAVIENIEYVDGGNVRFHSAYGFFVMGEGVCQAYAIAMQMLLEKAGIESFYVVGYLSESEEHLAHAWNLVKTESGWRHIDATSNDMGTQSEEQVSLYFYKLTDEAADQFYVWDKGFYPVAK